jgi:hypothetical protein
MERLLFRERSAIRQFAAFQPGDPVYSISVCLARAGYPAVA